MGFLQDLLKTNTLFRNVAENATRLLLPEQARNAELAQEERLRQQMRVAEGQSTSGIVGRSNTIAGNRVNPIVATDTQNRNYTSAGSNGFDYSNNITSSLPSAPSAEEISGFYSGEKGKLEDAINKYVGDLRNEAQGDYDFAIKWIGNQHEIALGNNDQKRAEFFEKVADSLEKEIGRIPYDYLQKTEREQRDISDFLRLQDIKKQDQLAREQEFQSQQGFEKQQEATQRGETFNSRGLLGSGIQKRQAELDALKRQLYVTDPQQRSFGLEGTLRGLETERGVLESGRRLEDITTTARRGGIDAEDTYQMSSEQAQRTLANRLAEIKRVEEQEKRNAELQALLATQQRYGVDDIPGV